MIDLAQLSASVASAARGRAVAPVPSADDVLRVKLILLAVAVHQAQLDAAQRTAPTPRTVVQQAHPFVPPAKGVLPPTAQGDPVASLVSSGQAVASAVVAQAIDKVKAIGVAAAGAFALGGTAAAGGVLTSAIASLGTAASTAAAGVSSAATAAAGALAAAAPVAIFGTLAASIGLSVSNIIGNIFGGGPSIASDPSLGFAGSILSAADVARLKASGAIPPPEVITPASLANAARIRQSLLDTGTKFGSLREF